MSALSLPVVESVKSWLFISFFSSYTLEMKGRGSTYLLGSEYVSRGGAKGPGLGEGGGVLFL